MSLLSDYVHIMERHKVSEKDIEFRFFCACSPRCWALFRQSNQQQMDTELP